MKFINKILVPTDLSDLSLAAMEYAVSISKIYNAKITMVYVIEQSPAFTFPEVDYNSETLLRDALINAGEELRKFVDNKLPLSRSINTVVRRGDPRKEIVKYAEDEEFDMIVMATHGRTGFAHMLMGSIAEHIVRSSAVPVLTVKPEEMQNNVVAGKEFQNHFNSN